MLGAWLTAIPLRSAGLRVGRGRGGGGGGGGLSTGLGIPKFFHDGTMKLGAAFS